MTIYDEPAVTTAPPYGTINPGEYSFDEGDITGQVRSNYEEIRQIQAYLSNQQQDISGLTSMTLDWAQIGDLYVPDATSTPRVQITTAPFGGIAILGSGDTYDDETGTGTAKFLFDYTSDAGKIAGWVFTQTELKNVAGTVVMRGAGNLAFGSTPPTSATVGTGVFIDNTGIYGLNANTQEFYVRASDGKAVFGAGAAVLDSAGIALSGDSSLNITGTVTTGSAAAYKVINEVITGTIGNGKVVTGLHQSITHSTTATTGGIRGIYADFTANEGLTSVTGISSSVTVASGKTVGTYIGANVGTLSAGSITEGYGFAASLTVGGGTTIRGFVVSALSGATNNRGIEIQAPASGANNYAIYSSAAAQSVHAGNVRIGSTTAPTVALNVSGEASFDPSIAGDATIGVNNVSSNAAAGMAISMSVPATSTTGDVRINQTIVATQAWAFGIDNSDSDAWVLSENASLGTSNRIRALGSQFDIVDKARFTGNGLYLKDGTAGFGTDTDGVMLDLAFDTAGTDLAVNVIHSAASGAGHAVLSLSTHPSGTGDPQVHFRISGTQSWRVGVDNSDADAFIVSRGSGLGTSNTLRISTSDEAHFLGRLGVGVSPTVAGRLFWSQFSTAATTLDTRLEHTDNTSGSSHNLLSVIVGGATAGDPFLNFRVAGATDWSLGIDNSVSNDPFVLARSTALGTTNIASFLVASVTLADPYDVVLGSTTGTKIGTATTQKLGFYGATPIVRPSAYTQTYSTADKTHATDGSADFPAGGVGTAAGGWSTAANRDLAITRFNALRVTVTDLKQLVNSIIDDLQALGLVG